MRTLTRVPFVFALAVLAGCASSQPAAGPAGKHLVYRDSSGAAVRQFDYPDVALCQKVEAVAGSGARCQAEPASGLTAKATLLYLQHGFMVESHYSDINRCHAETRALSAGVLLAAHCSESHAQGAAAARVEPPHVTPAVTAPAVQRTASEPQAPQMLTPSHQAAAPRQAPLQPPSNRPLCSAAHQSARLCNPR